MIWSKKFSARAWARRFGIALAPLLMLGVAAEVALRLSGGPDPFAEGASEIMQQIKAQSALSRLVHAPDPELGALLAPSLRETVETLDFTYTLQTDHAGFPNPEPWPSRADVAVLGDSLLIGPGVGMERQFTTLLQQGLDGRTVLNLGLPGGGTEHEYLAYRRYVEPLRPGLVIAIVCVTWDIDNTLHFERWRTEGADSDFTQYRMTFGDTHQSRWQLVKNQLARSHLVRAGYGSMKSLRNGTPFLEQVTFANGDTVFLSTREQRRLAEGLERPGVSSLREIFFRPLEALRTEVEAYGGRFVVALLPSKEELYGAEVFPAVLRPVQEVRAELEARQLPVLDLYPAFRELGQERPPFYRADIHLNELGNQIVADAIGRWIQEEGIFPAPSTAPDVAASGAD
jgi:SGNH hydrolase-like domain, acetyltransferase AlgX